MRHKKLTATDNVPIYHYVTTRSGLSFLEIEHSDSTLGLKFVISLLLICVCVFGQVGIMVG